MKGHSPEFSWVNGRESAVVSVTNRGLQYGDGLFETILVHHSKPVLLEEHFTRLFRDSTRLALRVDSAQLRNEFTAFLNYLIDSGIDSGVIKILLTRESTGRGYAPDRQAGVDRLFQFYPGIRYPEDNRKGVAIALSSHRLSLNPALAGVKHLNRLEQVLAQGSFPKPLLRGLPFAEALLLDTRQRVTECVYSNVFVVKQGQLLTPSLSECGVRGVMRDYLLNQVAPQLKISCREQTIFLPELLDADEIFICNSVYGIWPVTALESRHWEVGPLTLQLQKKADELGYAQIHA